MKCQTKSMECNTPLQCFDVVRHNFNGDDKAGRNDSLFSGGTGPGEAVQTAELQVRRFEKLYSQRSVVQ